MKFLSTDPNLFLKPNFHLIGFYWGHQCSWTLTQANSMQVSIVQTGNCTDPKSYYLCLRDCTQVSLASVSLVKSKIQQATLMSFDLMCVRVIIVVC